MKKKFIVLFLAVISNYFAFNVNEKLVFEIKYGIISAGEASLTVKKTTYQDSIPVFIFTTEAKTNSFFDKLFKVRDTIESVWDAKLKVSRKFTKNFSEGSYKQLRIHNYYPYTNKTFYQHYNHKERKFRSQWQDIPPKTQDILSAFFMARNMNYAPGDTLHFNVTVDKKSYQANVAVLQRQTIDTIYGKIPCLKIEPILRGEGVFKQTGNIYIWVTDDKYKIPVLLESEIIFGSFKAILKEAQNVPYTKE